MTNQPSQNDTFVSYHDEVWKTIVYDFLPADANRLAVSNHGRVRSFACSDEGRLVTGTPTRTNLTTVNLRYCLPRAPVVAQRFAHIKQQLFKLRADLRVRKKALDASTPPDPDAAAKYKTDHELYEHMRTRYLKEVKEDERKRALKYGGYVHRLVALHFCEPESPLHNIVIHLDHDNTNNHYTNLRWATHDEMVAHIAKNPIMMRERENRKLKENKGYKLNEMKVKLIKKALSRKVPTAELAKRFGVSQAQIRYIRRGDSWGHVNADE